MDLIERLEGTWSGRGRGKYPTIDDFDYLETIELRRLPGKPVLSYSQATRSPEGAGLHAESGFYRFTDSGVELVIAQATGIAETHLGKVAGDSLVFEMTGISATTSAVEVTQVGRRLTLCDDTLTYSLDMAAVDQPMQVHLEATLTRQ